MSIRTKAFGPITDRSEDAARGFFQYKQEPVGRMFIQYQTKRWRCCAIQRLTAQSAGNLYTFIMSIIPTVFGSIMVGSKSGARGFILSKHESIGPVFMIFSGTLFQPKRPLPGSDDVATAQ